MPEAPANSSRWQNFQIWRGRLPHWRADGVTYYATFRHRRPLDEWERRTLLRCLLRPDGRKLDLVILCVLPEATEMMFTAREAPTGETYEFSDVIEKAIRKGGKEIIAKSEERFPPFFTECFDRIPRDEAEIEELFLSILESPVKAEIVEDPDAYDSLYVRDAE
ncbi:hypothetical protein EON79_12270 [bacterium]|nr:MAG: hypothetical protein EON79_12270 [bacterium]